MKVTGSKVGTSSRVGGKTPSAGSGGGSSFTAATSGAREAAAPTRAGGIGAVGSLDALLALQQLDGPTERRRRATGRANRILDVLDGLKIALLDGEAAEGSLMKLMEAVRQERSETEDPGLEGVLDEIETRAAVELAKAEAAAA